MSKYPATKSPAIERPATDRRKLPETQTAALAALSISESLILTLVETGALEAQAARRCLLDAAAGFDTGAAPREIRGQTAALIDSLLQQIDAVSPTEVSGEDQDGDVLLPR
ncbi:hypothetical protein [Pelagibius sp. 7325]|uniref:hypothetical protein n=1 Tax=Pelagibius sp. 7325 TaxID=3131994 RepID=UPI0030EB4926